MSRKLKAVFIASLILNVLFVSFALNTFVYNISKQGAFDRKIAQTGLSAEEQGKLKQQLDAILSANGDSREEMQRQLSNVIAALTAAEFNEWDYKQAVDRMDEARRADRRKLSRAIQALATQLSQPQRIALSQMLQRSYRDRQQKALQEEMTQPPATPANVPAPTELPTPDPS